jgi:hypothetical protein
MMALVPYGFAGKMEVNKALGSEAESTCPLCDVEALAMSVEADSSSLGAKTGGTDHGNSRWSGRSYVDSHHMYDHR